MMRGPGLVFVVALLAIGAFEASLPASASSADCPAPQPIPRSSPQPAPRPNSCRCVQQTINCAIPGPAAPQGSSDKDDKGLKVIELVLASVKENAERAVKAAESSNETVKWVYIVQSSVITIAGGVLAYLGFGSWKDFRRLQMRSRKQRSMIRRRFLEESKRIDSWVEINTQFTAASSPLATLAAIRDDEVREEFLRRDEKEVSDEFSRAQRENRKMQALSNALNALRKLKALALEAEHARFVSWADCAEAAANASAGNLDEGLRLALAAKTNNPMKHADRAYWVGFIYARMYYERRTAEFKESAFREFRETFSNDPSGSFLETARRDKELELYLGKDTINKLAADLFQSAKPAT